MKRFCFTVTALLMSGAAMFFAACGNKERSQPAAEKNAAAQTDGRYDWLIDTSPVTITLFEDWPGGVNDYNLIGIRKLQEATGVLLDRRYPAVWDGQELILMLASNSLPDMVVMENGAEWKNSFIQQAVEAGAIWAYDDLIENYAPHFKELAAPEYFEAYRAEDGKTYQYVNAINTAMLYEKRAEYGVVGNQGVTLVRKDFFEEAGSPDMTTPGGFIDGFKRMMANHPALIPLLTPWDTWADPLGPFGNEFNVPPYYVENGKAYHRLRAPQALETVLFLNRLVREKILPKEAIIEGTDVQALVFNGKLIAYRWNTLEEGKVPDDNPNTIYTFIPPLATWRGYDTASVGGWKAILISKNAKNPDRAVRALEFMASEEGHKLLYWGNEGPAPENGGLWTGDLVNGPHYYVDGRGKPTYYPEFWAAKAADWGGVEARSGLMQVTYGEDSYYRNVTTWNDADPITRKTALYFNGKTEYVPWMSISAAANSEYDAIDNRVKLIAKNYVASTVYAASEQEAGAEFRKMIAEMEAAGLAKLEEMYTAKYNEQYAKYHQGWN